MAADERPSRIPDLGGCAPEAREALRYFYATWYEFSSLDPVLVDLCRLKSAHLNDCNW